MLKALQVSAPIEQQVATAEMEYSNSAVSGPAGASAMEYCAQVPVNTAATFLQKQQPSEEHLDEAAEPEEEMEEFNVFRDYFGLINLVKSFANVPDDFLSPPTTNEYYSVGVEPETSEMRERRDSLGSAGSEFSSSNSAESVEVADIYYTAYGHHLVGMKQAFMEPVREESGMKGITSGSLPASLLLEHKIITSAAAKKPQVSVQNSCRVYCFLAMFTNFVPPFQVCVFCRNNGESESFYTSHYLKDSEGKVTCPVLRAYTCPLCGANGDAAHTIKYCPENTQSVKNGGVKRATITVTRKK